MVEHFRRVTLSDTTAVDAVCWDWNGTLLDDTAVALEAMNAVLDERGLPVMPHVEAYRKVFGFPVQAFYGRLGIGDADFRAAAERYLKLFASRVAQAQLHTGVEATLSAISRLGVEQVLISATVTDVLDAQMAPHAIAGQFHQILGIADPYAASKADVVASWLQASGHDPLRVLMVGDTNHDEEIAERLCLSFVRFAHGHQQPPTHDRHPVVHHLSAVLQHVRVAPVRRGVSGSPPAAGERS